MAPRNTKVVVSLLAGAVMALAASAAHAADPCEDLARFKLDGGRVDSAVVATPDDKLEYDFAGIPPLPAPGVFCRVKATLTPTPSSAIGIEVWLPAKDAWNGKFLAVGNGGFAGGFGGPYLLMGPALKRGYATAGTDTGHKGSDAKWALGQPEKIKDYAWRANHLTAEATKALIKAYYASAPSRAYFQGCSNGGREALMEAQRFPGDYDGIVAGAPANAWTPMVAGFAWNQAALMAPGAALAKMQLAAIQDAVLEQCDELDGVKDGVIDDPRQCRFDIAKLGCKPGEAGGGCLTPEQIVAWRKIHDGPRIGGKAVFPGFPVGGEGVPGAWDSWIAAGDAAQQAFLSREFYANMVYGQPDWALTGFDLARDYPKADAMYRSVLNSDDPDLSAFKARGGKLILDHGWADAAITPLATIGYYEKVRARMGAASDGFVRLFMAPGVSHCFMGPGPDGFDMVGALEQWVEHGQAPDRIIAEKRANGMLALLGAPPGDVLRSRPLCPYPQVARWTGEGSTDEAANFVCRAPEGAKS